LPPLFSKYASQDEADIDPLLPPDESIETPATDDPEMSLTTRQFNIDTRSESTDPNVRASKVLNRMTRWSETGPHSAWQSAIQPGEQNGRGDLSLLCGLLPIIVILVLDPSDLSNPSLRTLVLASIWLVVSVIAIIAGGLGIREVRRHRASNMGVAIAGLVLGSMFFLLLVAAYMWVTGILGR